MVLFGNKIVGFREPKVLVDITPELIYDNIEQAIKDCAVFSYNNHIDKSCKLSPGKIKVDDESIFNHMYGIFQSYVEKGHLDGYDIQPLGVSTLKDRFSNTFYGLYLDYLRFKCSNFYNTKNKTQREYYIKFLTDKVTSVLANLKTHRVYDRSVIMGLRSSVANTLDGDESRVQLVVDAYLHILRAMVYELYAIFCLKTHSSCLGEVFNIHYWDIPMVRVYTYYLGDLVELVGVDDELYYLSNKLYSDSILKEFKSSGSGDINKLGIKIDGEELESCVGRMHRGFFTLKSSVGVLTLYFRELDSLLDENLSYYTDDPDCFRAFEKAGDWCIECVESRVSSFCHKFLTEEAVE